MFLYLKFLIINISKYTCFSNVQFLLCYKKKKSVRYIRKARNLNPTVTVTYNDQAACECASHINVSLPWSLFFTIALCAHVDSGILCAPRGKKKIPSFYAETLRSTRRISVPQSARRGNSLRVERVSACAHNRVRATRSTSNYYSDDI